MNMSSSSPSAANLQTEAAELRLTIEKAQAEFKRENQFRRVLSLSFLKGVVSALGALTVVIIIIPVALWFLSVVEWSGLIGDFVSQIILQIEQSNPPSPQGAADQ